MATNRGYYEDGEEIDEIDSQPSSLYPEVHHRPDPNIHMNGASLQNGALGINNQSYDRNPDDADESSEYPSIRATSVNNGTHHTNGFTNGGIALPVGEDSANSRAAREEPAPVALDDDDDLESSDDPGKKKKKKKSDEDPPASLRSLFRFATGLDWLLMLLGAIFALVHGFAFPFLAIVFGNMVNTLKPRCPDDFPIPANATSGDFTYKMCLLAGKFDVWNKCHFNEQMNEQVYKYAYIGAGVMVASFIHVTCYLLVCERQMHMLRRVFLRQILRQDLPFFDKHQSGELTTRLADDMERVREGTGDKLGFIIQLFAQFFGGFAIGFYYNWKLTLSVMSLTPLTAVSFAILGKAISASTTKEQRAYAKAGGMAEEVLSTIKIVLAFNGQQKAKDRYNEKLMAAQAFAVRKSVFIGVGLAGFLLSIFGSYAVALWVGSILVESGEIDSGTVYTVLFAVMTGAFGIGGASPHITAFFTAKASAGALYTVIDRVPAVDAFDETRGERNVVIRGDVELKNVRFAYPAKPDMQVLKGISLHARRGETIALVGNSGCGKSTIVNLVERFYDVQDGQVLVDGRDVREYNVRTLRSQLGLVSQLPVLFGFTIEENIKLGRDDTISDAIMIDACKTANIHNFIMTLPKKYQTLVGDKGTQLSGGQRQRVAVARAIVCQHVPILLLDEATSALDTESEKLVQAALEKASADRTTIVIAHRLSTIRNANMIHVIDKGEIVESGTHDELMQKRGEYYELIQMQTMRGDKLTDLKQAGEANAAVNGAADRTPHSIFRKQSSFDVAATTDDPAVLEAGREAPLSPGGSPTKRTMFGTKREDVEEAEKKLDLEGPMPGFGRIFRENLPELPFILFGLLCGSTINGSAMPVFSLFFGQMFSVLNERGEALHRGVLLWAMAFVILGVAQAFSNFISTWAFTISGERLTRRLRYKVFDNILRQDLTFFDNPKNAPGKLTTRLATDASTVKTATGVRMGIIMQSFTALLTAFIIGMIFGWKFCLCLVAIMPLLLVSGYFSLRLHTGNQKKDSKAMEDAGHIATEAIENVATVQALTREMYIHSKFCAALEQPHQQNMRRAFLYALAFAFSQALVFFTYAGAFKLGAYFITTCDLLPANMFKVFFAITFVAVTIGQWGSLLPEYSKAKLSAGLIFQMLATRPKIDSYMEDGEKRRAIQGAIEFRNVSFRYPERSDVLVLDDVSFRVDPGQSLGIVGPSGSGKSTIVALLERFYDPDTSSRDGKGKGELVGGQILIDGRDLREYNLQHYRRQVALVLQEPLLFKASFQDNIAYGIDDADRVREGAPAHTPSSTAHARRANVELDMPRIVHAAKEANIHDYIMTLPKQYQESVGDRGQRLSGGQRQRVTISRAIVRRPKILLLDEATSALDSQSEQLVQAALERAVKGVTSVIIAHRLSTLKQTDKILVLDRGKVVEQGSQDELLAKEGGLYRQLCQVQDVK